MNTVHTICPLLEWKYLDLFSVILIEECGAWFFRIIPRLLQYFCAFSTLTVSLRIEKIFYKKRVTAENLKNSITAATLLCNKSVCCTLGGKKSFYCLLKATLTSQEVWIRAYPESQQRCSYQLDHKQCWEDMTAKFSIYFQECADKVFWGSLPHFSQQSL